MKNKFLKVLASLMTAVIVLSATAMPAFAAIEYEDWGTSYDYRDRVCLEYIKADDFEGLTAYIESWKTEENNNEGFDKMLDYVRADDRVGLYDYLVECYILEHYPDYTGEYSMFDNDLYFDHYFTWFLTQFRGTYATGDEDYAFLLKMKVLPADPNVKEPPISTPELVPGDANMDNRISITDIISINKIAVGIITPNNVNHAIACDFNNTGRIDMNDVTDLMYSLVFGDDTAES